jgi:hypothetical protein
MLTLIGGFLIAVLNFVLYVLVTAFSWFLRLLWPVWLALALIGFMAATAQPAQAGWFDWIWGSDSAQLERAAEIAQEAARVTSASAQAHAQQSAAQATQNSRVAELLSHLSEERQGLAGYLTTLAELGLQDSQWAAALSATGPVVVSTGILIVAALALWTVSKTGPNDQMELADALDFLALEVAVYGQARADAATRLSAHATRTHALTGPADGFGEGDDSEPPRDDDEEPLDPPPF